MTEFRQYPGRSSLMKELAGLVAEELKRALMQKGSASLAVPGGTTPGPFFEHLRAIKLDWSRVSVLLTDERFVPESSPRSNTALIRQTLLQEEAAEANYVPLYEEAATPERVLDLLQERVQAVLPLDVCVLGMGADMHTASLFPGGDLLARALDCRAPVLLPMRAPGADEPRLTLTAPVFRMAGVVHLLITGEEKRAALTQAGNAASVLAAPVRVVLDREDPTLIHYAD